MGSNRSKLRSAKRMEEMGKVVEKFPKCTVMDMKIEKEKDVVEREVV